LQELVYDDVGKGIQMQTKQLFYALLYKKRVLEVYEENLSYWEENYRQVEGKFKAGILPKVELMRAKAQLESARADYLKSVESFKAFLRYEGELKPEGELKEVSPPDMDYLKALEENNSTLKVARANLRVFERLVALQKAQYYPNLQAFVNYQGSTVRSLSGGSNFIDGYSVGVRFNYNLFDGFSRESKIAQANIDLQKQRENLLDLEYNLKAQLRSLLLDIQALKVQLSAVKASLESAKESLRLSTERYKYGVASQLEVLDARNNYNNVLLNYYLILYQLNGAIAQLERLTR
ncbi:MAG: TolC family protein, partial [Aquificota bacterium]